MKLTINIKEHKVPFFLELLRNFEDFVTVEQVTEAELADLTPEHKAILDDRLASYTNNPDNLLNWEEVRAELEQNL